VSVGVDGEELIRSHLRNCWCASTSTGFYEYNFHWLLSLRSLLLLLLLLLLLQVDPGSEPGWVKVQLSAAGSGWLGFGVADPGAWVARPSDSTHTSHCARLPA
jgi:hypothetical protein